MNNLLCQKYPSVMCIFKINPTNQTLQHLVNHFRINLKVSLFNQDLGILLIEILHHEDNFSPFSLISIVSFDFHNNIVSQENYI